ncbi:hypothetical protein AVEN_177633-1 [Araneus ventricosus]|uniref:Uncharacterized protein n=1 Tax=Araneus ventricosus TaxID=182803 RepID=A0A4Y2XAA2_ARAVE|nr:hypothetical protein AVEN_177633-1 [Araneus ventricosus]
MKIVDGIRRSFRCVSNMEKVTRKEIEVPAFINECMEKNFAFLESLPNSLPPISHTLDFQRNKRELREISDRYLSRFGKMMLWYPTCILMEFYANLYNF